MTSATDMRIIELHRSGASARRIANAVGMTDKGVQKKLKRLCGERNKLVDHVRPYVASHHTIREVHRLFPEYSRQAIACAMVEARKQMGLPKAICRAGGPLRLPLLIHDRLSLEAKERGYDTATDLADAILNAVISDNLIDAVLDQDEARAA